MANVLKPLWLQSMQKLRKNSHYEFLIFCYRPRIVVCLSVCLSVCKFLIETTFPSLDLRSKHRFGILVLWQMFWSHCGYNQCRNQEKKNNYEFLIFCYRLSIGVCLSVCLPVCKFLIETIFPSLDLGSKHRFGILMLWQMF